MEENIYYKPMQSIIIIYLICFLFRVIEYMFFRTDQTIFGEAFIHKLVGIIVLLLASRYFLFKWTDVGFMGKQVIKNILLGLILCSVVFLIAYGTEFFLQFIGGKGPKFEFYVTSYAVGENLGRKTGLLFLVACLIGNVINVVMEEGVFRGLFIKLLEIKYSFFKAVIFSSILFGIWHIIAPIRSLLDGKISIGGAIMTVIMLVLTTGLTGAKFCLLTKITGSLWTPMADHFLNNTIINLLHITTISGSDELQVIRISIAQTISFIIVLFIYFKSKSYKKLTFRT